MKAAAIMKTDVLQVLDLPRPAVAEDQILVRVAWCGVCATDYDNFRGTTSFAKNGDLVYPLRFGHEWSGIVCAFRCG